MNIDFVIPWVDGNDPQWRKERNRYSNTPVDSDECRFRDWDLLRYWFRAVEAYAPWVNRIHLVTWNQIPPWLNISHPKLHLVDHRDFIPEEYFPTFSSHTIELNFHRIADLSEYFVYFNDDMFLNAPVETEDFFRNKLPCDCAIMGIFAPMDTCVPYTHAQCNVIGFLNMHFDKPAVLKRNPFKWFAFRYGKGFLKNVYGCVTRHFSNLCNFHIPSSMLKSTYETVWSLDPELLHNTCLNKFRQLGDVNQYIMSYYNICMGNFSPRSAAFGKCYSVGNKNEELYRDILKGLHKTICINDHEQIENFQKERDILISIYEKKLPEKSLYEL